jgi:hypothetical protein
MKVGAQVTSQDSMLPAALLALSASLLAFGGVSMNARAEISEIDSFQMAVTSQTREASLAFIKAYPSSHLITDLFDLLPPEIAQQVCTELADKAPARVQHACATLRRVSAIAAIDTAAGPISVENTPADIHVPMIQSSSIAASPYEDPATSQVAVRRSGKHNDNNTTYWLIPTRPNAHRSEGSNGGDSNSNGGVTSGANAGNAGGSSDSGATDSPGSSSSSGNGVPFGERVMLLVARLGQRATPRAMPSVPLAMQRADCLAISARAMAIANDPRCRNPADGCGVSLIWLN